MAGPALSAKGGMSSVAQGYFDAGLAERCDVTYLATMVEGNPGKKLAAALGSYLLFCHRVKSCDLVHLHVSRGASYVRKRLLARRANRAGVPYVLHVHTGEFDVLFQAAPRDKQDEVRQLFSEAAAVIALSEEWRDCFIRLGCGTSDNVVVLHNGVAVPDTAAQPGLWENILFLGRLDARKCPDVLLRAAAEVLPGHPNARVKLAGDGEISPYRQLASDLGIADRCDFLGWVEQAGGDRLMREGAALCLPSRHEGMPMAILEAMAYGLPVVATPVGGVPQIIRDGENGLFMPVDDWRYLAGLLDGLLSDPGRRAALGAAGRKTVQSHFDIGTCLEELLRLYDFALSRRGRPRPSYGA